MSERRGLDPRSFLPALRTRELGRTVELREQVVSTNDLALAAGMAGATHGLVIAADGQTAGRGRSGARWLAPARTAILASVLLRERLAGAGLARATLAAGLATCRMVRGCGVGAAELKWPNDVLVHGRKLAGILCEGRFQGEGQQLLVVGLGLNVLQGPDELPEGATSLRLEGVVLPERERLLADWLVELERELERLATGRWAEVRADWQEHSPGQSGRRVRVNEGAQAFDGTSAGIDDDGALRVRRDDGDIVRVLSGSIRPL